MMNTNSKVKISGFRVSKETFEQINTLLQKLERTTPMGSNLRLHIVNGESDINAFLSIKCEGFKFEASNCGSNPIVLVRDLIRSHREKLHTWMDQRVFA